MTGWFGTSWGAPVCDPAHRTNVPVGEPCHWCEEPFTADDSGVVIPFITSETDATFVFYHRECFMRTVVGSIGHQLKVCSCYGGTEDCEPPEQSRREQARAACKLAEDLARIEEPSLDVCAVCGRIIGFGVRALHLGRCDEHREGKPS